jgi:hypothetical protein
MRVFALILALSLTASAAELPNAPAQDSYSFHRGEDFAFGALVSMPVGVATKPWIGLLAGEAAGIANEARYGQNFNKTHLLYISAGSLVSYGLVKLEKRTARKNRVKYGQ